MELLDRVQGRLAVRGVDMANEQRDIHEIDQLLLLDDLHPEFKAAVKAREGASIVGNGKKLKTIRGMGTVYDWRQSPWTPANGGKIKPLVYIQHIPVVPNKVGIADFVTLRNVLVAQGLMVQSSTDREGNVALFTPLNQLCFHARGANSFSTGTEHMHMSITEDWTKRQLRAAAWLMQLAQKEVGIPVQQAKLGTAGPGLCRVLKKGHTGHEDESNKAGYHDRIDPGHVFFHAHWDYIVHCVKFFKQHGHFEGA